MQRIVRVLLVVLLLGLAGCAGLEDPAFQDEPTQVRPTRILGRATAEGEDEPTVVGEDEPTVETPEEPTPEVIEEGIEEIGIWRTYTSDDGSWSVRYRSDLLQPEQLSVDITLFISEDRSTFFAVDTYHSEEYEFGNTGEGMRNRARLAASIIYGKDVEMVDVLENPDGPWEMGITFVTDGGSKGEAVYEQAGVDAGDKQVYGALFGYKRAAESDVLGTLEHMRENFQRRR